MEEHLRSQKALITNIDIDHVSIDSLVNEPLKLCRLDHLTFNSLFLIIFCKLFLGILGYITILLLDLRCNLVSISSSKFLTTISELGKSELSDVSSGKWNMFDTR